MLSTEGIQGEIHRSSPEESRARLKILLVDDRQENIVALTSLFRGESVEIHSARSGVEALDLMLDHEFAVALVDVQMPEMNGFELAEAMRGAERTRHIPIIFVTAGMRSEQNTFQGYEAGAVDFLYKPLDPFVVKSKVKVFLELASHKKQLNQRLHQIEETVAALRRTEAELQKAVRARDEFLSIASHELKTPLTPLKLQIQSLLRLVRVDCAGSDGTGSAETRTRSSIEPRKLLLAVERSDEQIRRMTALIDNLLDVTRIGAGQLTIERRDTDLSALLSGVADRFAEMLRVAGCEVRLEVPAGIRADVDPARIEQVVVNLISNAIKYAPGCPLRIAVEVDAARGDARIRVRDRGPGIHPDDHAKVFSRFERAAANQAVSGLGLGLFITRQIVEAHGGSIHLESAPGEGSEFIVRLPVATPSAPTHATEVSHG